MKQAARARSTAHRPPAGRNRHGSCWFDLKSGTQKTTHRRDKQSVILADQGICPANSLLPEPTAVLARTVRFVVRWSVQVMIF